MGFKKVYVVCIDDTGGAENFLKKGRQYVSTQQFKTSYILQNVDGVWNKDRFKTKQEYEFEQCIEGLLNEKTENKT